MHDFQCLLEPFANHNKKLKSRNTSLMEPVLIVTIIKITLMVKNVKTYKTYIIMIEIY